MQITPEQAWAARENAELIYDAAAIEQALDRMAAAIERDLATRDPLVLCVMNGALLMTGALLQRLNFPLTLDYLHASRYREQTTGAELQWHKRPQHPLKDRSLLILDDILDEGVTLDQVVGECLAEGASEVRTAVLVRKVHARCNGFQADYVGLDVSDRYVFGFGMDYMGYLRNLPGIYALGDD